MHLKVDKENVVVALQLVDESMIIWYACAILGGCLCLLEKRLEN